MSTPGWLTRTTRTPSPTWRPRTPTPRRPRPGSPRCGIRSSPRSRRGPRRATCRSRCARAAGGSTRGRWRASSTPCTAAARSGRARFSRPSRPTASRWTGRKCCWTATSWPPGPGSSPSAPTSRARTGAGWPTPPTSPGTSGSRSGSRTWPAARWRPMRSPAPITGAHGRWTARSCSTSRSTTRGARTACGGTWSAPRPARTSSCSRRPTSGSTSTSAGPAATGTS